MNVSQEIAEWLNNHQITKCPTAAACKSPHIEIDPRSRNLIRLYNKQHNESREIKKLRRLQKIRQNFF